LLIAVWAVISGGDKWVDMEGDGKAKQGWRTASLT